MNLSRVAAVTLVLGGIMHQADAATTNPARDSSGERSGEIDLVDFGNYIDRRIREDRFSGVVVVARGGQMLLQRAGGIANRDSGTPITVETKFNTASMYKMFTAVAVAKLIAEGKLKLDDTVSRFLGPEWLSPAVAGAITVRDLLTHTSGLGDYFTDDFLTKSRLLYREIDDFKPLILCMTPTAPAGSKFQYSNAGFLLLGAVIAKASGVTYETYLERALFHPAGMTDTGLFDIDSPLPGAAVGYVRERRGPPPRPRAGIGAGLADEALVRALDQEVDQTAKAGFRWRTNLFMHVVKGTPAGGGFTTAPDLVRFAQALQDDRIVPAKVIGDFERPSALAPPDDCYGMGFTVNGHAIGHSGGFPGISDDFLLWPKTGLTLIVLSNYSNASVAIVARFRDLYEGPSGSSRRDYNPCAEHR